MKLSIIVPVYKTPEKYLRECIESLAMQTLTDIEVLLIDDGSPDNCGKICDEYSALYTNVRSIHQKNKGVSVARNRGISEAQGEYLMFVDADDVLFRTAGEKAYNASKKYDSNILIFKYANTLDQYNEKIQDAEVFCEFDIHKMQLQIINKLYPGQREGYSVGSPWAKIFKREFVVDNKIIFKPGLKKSQDRLFMLNCLEKCKIVHFLDYKGYCYNTHAESVCWNYNPNITSIAENMICSFGDFVKEYHENEDAYNMALSYFKINVLFEVLHLDFFHKSNMLGYRKRYCSAKACIEDSLYNNALKEVEAADFGRNREILIKLFRRKKYGTAFFILDANRKLRKQC